MNTYYLGTAVKISAIIDVDTATSAKITIEDPSGVEKVDDADMTKEDDRVYYYIYQSDENDSEGTYKIIIKITYNSYTSVSETTIDFVEQ